MNEQFKQVIVLVVVLIGIFIYRGVTESITIEANTEKKQTITKRPQSAQGYYMYETKLQTHEADQQYRKDTRQDKDEFAYYTFKQFAIYFAAVLICYISIFIPLRSE